MQLVPLSQLLHADALFIVKVKSDTWVSSSFPSQYRGIMLHLVRNVADGSTISAAEVEEARSNAEDLVLEYDQYLVACTHEEEGEFEEDY